MWIQLFTYIIATIDSVDIHPIRNYQYFDYALHYITYQKLVYGYQSNTNNDIAEKVFIYLAQSDITANIITYILCSTKQ